MLRVLAKPELENQIILNEFVVIMENFGVMDQMDEDQADDYIPDTETEVDKESVRSKTSATEKDQDAKGKDEEKKDDKEKGKDKDKDKKKDEKEKKSRKRVHNLSNIDEKGIKILRKLARFLLKQFLHPREFFGKSIKKENIKTKKREFNIDVMKVKEFYLKIKIANIRKRLTENESLNMELCLDKKTHKDLFNVKMLVKALEELAEEEQIKLIKEEEEEAKRAKENKGKDGKNSQLSNLEDQVDTPRSSASQNTKDGKKDEEKKKEEEEKKDTQKGAKGSLG